MMQKIVIAMLAMVFFFPGFVYADHCGDVPPSEEENCQQEHDQQAEGGLLGNAGDLGIPAVDANKSQLDSILSTTFLVTGALATIFIIIGGLRYVLAFGSSDKVEQAKKTVIYAVVGLVISVFAYTIVNFVISNL